MYSIYRNKVCTSQWFWKMIITGSIVLLLFYIMASDLQEYHTYYMNKVTRPTSKHFVCIHLHGRQLEHKLFEFAYGFGIAQSIGSSLIMLRTEDIRNVFELKAVKFLKTTHVCDSFDTIDIQDCRIYDSNITKLDQERHYNLESCETPGFPSILYFDKFKHGLMKQLQFKKEIDFEAEAYFRFILQNEIQPTSSQWTKWTNIAVYVANRKALAKVLNEDPVDYMTKYLTVAINYYKTRITNTRFIVYSIDTNFVKNILSKQNLDAIYIDDEKIGSGKPEIIMKVLSLCDHVITSGAADMLGWWVGYFSSGTVVYPRRHMDNSVEGQHTNQDVFPHSWIGLVF